MLKFIKKNYCYFILYIIVFMALSYFGFTWFHATGDPIANYGFSNALLRGEVLYRDFNIITTPLYPVYLSIGLFIYNNYITLLISHSLLVTMCFILIYKLFGNKVYLFLLLSVFTRYANIAPTYNFMCFAMMIIIIYLENKYPDKDYLIGFFIALSVLSKHTVGCFFIIPSIILYYKYRRKLLKRFIGFIIPISIFIIYLIINNALYQFIDLCFLGLFDFLAYNGASHYSVNKVNIVIVIILIFINLRLIFNDKKNINNYYLLFTSFIAVPLFDFAHITVYLNSVLLMFFPYINIKNKHLVLLALLPSIVIESCLLYKYYIFHNDNIILEKDIKYFEFINDSEMRINMEKKVFNYFDSFNDSIIFSWNSMKYSIVRDKKITYFNVPLNGNFGYNGNRKMINKIKKMHNQIFIISIDAYKTRSHTSQFDKEIVKYIIDNYKKIDEDKKLGYAVYYKE